MSQQSTEELPEAAAPQSAPPDPAAAAAPPASPVSSGAAPEAVAPAATPSWAFERIDGLTKRAKTAEETVADLQRRLAAATPPAPEGAPAPAAPAFDPIKYQADVNAKAAELASIQTFNATCNQIVSDGSAVAADGKPKFPGFDAGAKVLQAMGAVEPDVIAVIQEAGNAAEVIAMMGKDEGEAGRILKLPPAQRGVALAKFVMGKKAAAPKLLSDAPAPHDAAVGGSGGSAIEGLGDDVPLEEWIARRDAEERKAMGFAN